MKRIIVSIIVIILIVLCALLVYKNNQVNTPVSEVVEVTDYPTEAENKVENPEISSKPEVSNDYDLLYYRFILNREPGVQSIEYETDGIEDNEENRKKYIQPYYTYHSDGFMRYIEEPQIIGGFYGTQIDFKNLSKFSVSKNYELMPRTIEFDYDMLDENYELFEFERKIREYYEDKNIYANNQPDSCRIDLNGDGDYLYIRMRAEKVEITEGDHKGSWVSINYDAFDKDGNHLTTLVSNLYPSYYIHMEDDDAYASLPEVDAINCLDIDNDSKMELIVEIPGYEFSMELFIYKYENGKIIGETGAKRYICP